MNKAIFYKERIKMRRVIPLAALILAAFTAYAIIAVWRRYTYSGAASVWLAVLDRGDVLFSSLRYLPALLGAAFAVAQFVPEMMQNRLKLTLHLRPAPTHRTRLSTFPLPPCISPHFAAYCSQTHSSPKEFSTWKP